ncbi:hypothetical protein CMO95_01925 [Candidatus Woesearchaeota archaeon]|nr:hypothetical protein [Candidatus Woesearchaeota archaeon]|tara:strand:+ start:10462 stop:10899 length:438 start_codon:yes stop_codon:yes gene_type:complete
MLEAIHFVRKAIITALTNNVSIDSANVPIYGRVPNNATFPYIRVYSVSNNEIDQNQTQYNMETITRIECIARYVSDDGGEYDVNSMVSQCLNLLRTRSSGYINLTSDGFTVYTSENAGITYIEDDLSDHTYYRGIIELSNRITQN